MPLKRTRCVKRTRCLIPLCPVCGENVETEGECRTMHYETVRQLREAIEWWADGSTLEEKLANCCGDSDHGRIYAHRRCARKPCGNCLENPDDLKKVRTAFPSGRRMR